MMKNLKIDTLVRPISGGRYGDLCRLKKITPNGFILSTVPYGDEYFTTIDNIYILNPAIGYQDVNDVSELRKEVKKNGGITISQFVKLWNSDTCASFRTHKEDGHTVVDAYTILGMITARCSGGVVVI